MTYKSDKRYKTRLELMRLIQSESVPPHQQELQLIRDELLKSVEEYKNRTIKPIIENKLNETIEKQLDKALSKLFK